ncbi:MAG: glycosyltransferase family 2 protein [bacterium]|nr:glycosyltransferase family 2 protein [bacterium]
MDLSIITVNFNTRDLLRNCLASIFNQKGIECDVWVVDNASGDGSVGMVENDFPKVKLIKNKQNLGFSKANNLALKKASGRFLFLLNSDTIFKDQTLAKIVDFLDKNPKIGALGIKVLNPDGSPQPSVGKFYNLVGAFLMLFGGERMGLLRSSPKKIREVDWVAGAALIIRREVLEKVGSLDENLFMYMEEVEWCFRIKKAGFRIFFYPEAEVVHYVRASGSKNAAILGIYKGLTYFYRKHEPLWKLLVLRTMLKTKAGLAWMIGFLSNNRYLKTTYAEAFHLA